MTTVTAASLLVDALIQSGVDKLFSLSGNQILPVYDATIGKPIEIIHTRHEAAAVHMADGWGRLTDKPGVALLTAGPGHCNGLSALYGAKMAEAPLVLLSGEAPRAQAGRGAFQEMDQLAVAAPVAKAVRRMEDPAQISRDVVWALATAVSGRPGPVVLSLPVDVLTAPGPAEQAPVEAMPALPDVDAAGLAEMTEALSQAHRPLILAGPSLCRGDGQSAVIRLSAATGAPALFLESPRGVNDPGLRQATRLLAEADLVLLLGKALDGGLRFGDPPFFHQDCCFLQIDPEENLGQAADRIQKRWIGLPLQAAMRLAAIAPEPRPEHLTWRDQVHQAQDASINYLQPQGQDSGRIHPLTACRAVQPYLDQGGIFVSDGGEFGQWAQAGCRSQLRLINGPSGSIGSALPLGLAAKLAHPRRPVFIFSEDGAFGYHLMEMDTALRCGLPVIALVGNDARWNAEVQLQIRQFGPDRAVGCSLLPTRYDQVVASLGGHGEHVAQAAELEPALARSLASGLPACINMEIQSLAAPDFRNG